MMGEALTAHGVGEAHAAVVDGDDALLRDTIIRSAAISFPRRDTA